MVWTVWIVPCFISDWFLATIVVVRVCRHVSQAELKRRVDAVCFPLFLSMNAESILVKPGPTGLPVVGMPTKTSQSQIEAWPRCQITSWYGDDHQDTVVPCWVGFEIMFGHKMVACSLAGPAGW